MSSIRPLIYITAKNKDIQFSVCLSATFFPITVILKVLKKSICAKGLYIIKLPFERVNRIILLHYKPKTFEQTIEFNSINLPANQYILLLRNRLVFFFLHRTRALFLLSRFWQSTVPRASSSPEAGIQSRSCVWTRTESWSIAIWKVTPTTNEPSRQRQAIRTWSWNLMVFKVICFRKTFAGLSHWSSNYNDSMQQALIHFIQSREAMRADHCVTK